MSEKKSKDILNETTEGKKSVEIAIDNVKKLKLIVEQLIYENEEAVIKMRESNETLAYVSAQFKTANEAFQTCLDRMETLEENYASSKRMNIVYTKSNLNGKSTNEVNGMHSNTNRFLQTSSIEISKQPLEIELNNSRAVAFWCKNFNATRPEIVKAMEVTGSKCWIVVLDYFKKLREEQKKKSADGS